MSTKVQNLVPFETSALFCSNCGMLLKLESNSSTSQCKFCNHITNVSGIFAFEHSIDLIGNEVVTKKEFN